MKAALHTLRAVYVQSWIPWTAWRSMCKTPWWLVPTSTTQGMFCLTDIAYAVSPLLEFKCASHCSSGCIFVHDCKSGAIMHKGIGDTGNITSRNILHCTSFLCLCIVSVYTQSCIIIHSFLGDTPTDRTLLGCLCVSMRFAAEPNITHVLIF